MKLDSLTEKWSWSSSANRRLSAGLILCCALAAQNQETPKDRIKAIHQLAKQGSSAVSQIGTYVGDSDLSVRREAVRTIVSLDTAASLDPLVKATADNDPELQIRATEGLVNFYLPGYVDKGIGGQFKKLGTAVKSRFTDTNDQVIDPSVQVRPEVITALGKLARGGASMESRAGAARALGILRGQAAIPDLIRAVQSNDTEVNYEGIIALQKIRDTTAASAVEARLKDPVERVQIAAIETTGLLQNRSALNQIRDAMDRSKSQKVKRTALAAMAMMPDKSTHSVFVYHLDDKDEAMRVAAEEGLARGADPADAPLLKKQFDGETKPPGRMAGAFGLVNLGQRDLGEFSPLKYLVNQLNSATYRGVASAYLKEVARDSTVRQSIYQALGQNPTKEEKAGLAQVLGASGDRQSIPYLETLAKDINPDIGKEALRAIQNIRVRTN